MASTHPLEAPSTTSQAPGASAASATNTAPISNIATEARLQSSGNFASAPLTALGTSETEVLLQALNLQKLALEARIRKLKEEMPNPLPETLASSSSSGKSLNRTSTSSPKIPMPTSIPLGTAMSTPKPLSADLISLPVDLGNLTGSFLTLDALISVSGVCKSTALTFRQPYEAKVVEELLRQILNANSKKVMEILSSFHPRFVKNLILMQVPGKEEYWSKKQNKMLCKRTWTSISPLEAAAWCGDNFLVRALLPFIPEGQKGIVADQLRSIKNRAATDENGGYLAPFRALISAYQAYLAQFNALYAARDWKTLNELWLTGIGLCQRALPTYGLQEFCDEKPHDPLPPFNKEPARSCLLWDKSEVVLDSVGVIYAFFKGARPRAWSTSVGMLSHVSFDLAAITSLCDVRTLQLSNIIESLLMPASVNSRALVLGASSSTS